jgi:hypothetical protein
MQNDGTRTTGGDMAPELQAKVERLMEEFRAVVDAMAEDRHLQKGIARIQLPFSMVAILDKERLSILAQFRMENRFASYFYKPERELTTQQAANSAQWEFGFEDPYIIQFPGTLLDQSSSDRHSALQAVSAQYIDSEFQRFTQLLSFMRTRPIFGQTSQPIEPRSILLLLPQDADMRHNNEAILKAIHANNLIEDEVEDISAGKSAVREMWYSLNRVAVVIADLTGTDAGVMYGLGIAHTLGKETILIHPQGSKYLTDIPRTYSIEYEDSVVGRAKLEEQLSEMLHSKLASVVED